MLLTKHLPTRPQVPVANLIGEENKGFSYIMRNFNHER
jgi:alkylation response protein AidB-like acyl-CoA dehydrogenase